MTAWDHYDEVCRTIGQAVLWLAATCGLYAVLFRLVHGAWPALR